MNVLLVASEITPLARTSDLADFAAALPPALRALGHDVRLVLPYYLRNRDGKSLEPPIATGFLAVGERQEQLRVYSTQFNGVPAYLLDIPAAFERDTFYGDQDDDRRFILFARGVMTLLLHLRDVEGWQPNVVHANDWQTALVPTYLKTYYHYTFGGIASILSVHDLTAQGVFNEFTLYLSGLSDGGMIEPRAGLSGNYFNFLARGLLFADIISMPSPTYSLEALTPEHGRGLHHLLQIRHERLAGVLPGIDVVTINPATDPSIAAPYSAEDLAGKTICKAALQQECGFEIDARSPLLAITGELGHGRGHDLVVQALPWLIERTDAQMVVLGNGEHVIEQALLEYSKRHPKRIYARITADSTLVQRVHAGSDACLLPARLQPACREALIALRYGSVPIAHVIGCFNDTVREGYEGNGFRFHAESAYDLFAAITRCLAAFRDSRSWKQLQSRGMREDHSWAASAREYVGLYDWARRVAAR